MTTEVLNRDTQSSVLISGGSGLIGRHLTALLLNNGYRVSHLSRTDNPVPGVTVFKWDPSKKIFDPKALKGVNYIIHLAGANIGEKRWTEKRKSEIVNSRIGSTQFLFEKVKESPAGVKAFICASAAGYYGALTSQKIFSEEDPPASDFLGSVCSNWEESARQFSNLGIRVVTIRTAVVLEKNDSALSKLLLPARFGLIIRTGKGSQYFPWIHFKDLCNIYFHAIKNDNLSGPYNAVAPMHCTNDSFMRALAAVTDNTVFLPPVPKFVMRLFLGEMSNVILEGSRISSDKICQSGFNFSFPDLKIALEDILHSADNRR